MVLTFAAVALLSANANAASVTLAWDANPETDITGYRVHFGTASRSYTEEIYAGNSTSITIPNLTNGVTYYFAATANSSFGIESNYSTELVHTIAPGPTPSPTPPGPAELLNISTRLFLQPDVNTMIGGFIVSGDVAKKVLLRAIGPSLATSGVPDPIPDPTLRLFDSSGSVMASNDNWRSNQAQVIQDTGLAPSDDREAALVAVLAPGPYTALVSDTNDTPGIALFEFYDLDPASSILKNLSTRGVVLTQDRVLIGGFATAGEQPATFLLRAIGPSLASAGVPNPLLDPMLEVYNSQGSPIYNNDNWRSDQEQLIISSHIAPSDDREAAILVTLSPGIYSAILRGANDSTGTALFEVYRLDQ